MCKPILGVKTFSSNIQLLSEIGRTALKINIEKKMSKYLLRFYILELIDTFLEP